MHYDLVIFDCDGVLVDSERLVNRIAADFFTQHGLPIEPDALRARFKGKTMKDLAVWAEAELAGRIQPDWLYELGMATAHGFQQQLRIVDGIMPVLETLVERNALMCVASNSPPARLALTLSVTGLDRLFGGRIFSASLVPRSKPAPDLFLHAAERFGIAPARCAVVEDSPSGIRAARAAGMAVFGYAGDEDPEVLAAAGAVVFQSMAALPELLGLP